ncbi:MAG: hypothetical protein EPO20_13390 [Betaproteobacteria bacterium]|nr:MAG: hypothetical protein EPO20_13390 [Betaproteobacteria bacterium]
MRRHPGKLAAARSNKLPHVGERKRILARLTLLACAAAAAQAGAQTYKPTPVDVCFNLGALRVVGPDYGGGSSPLPHEVLARLPEALAACEQAVKDRPNEGRLFARLARMRLLSGDGRGAAEAARKGAELKSSTARVVLGMMQVDGVHLPRDYAAAHELFRLAARDRAPHAEFNLGVMAANGWGMERDDEDAAAFFRRAALGRDPLAMQVMAQRYDKANAEAWLKKAAEDLDPEDLPTGMRIADLGRTALDKAALVAAYEQAARGGEMWAQAYMGMLYESGQWVRRDYAAAREWYRRAGEAGHVPSQWRMSKFYREGLGVAKDDAEARRWGRMWQVQHCEALEREAAGANACDRLAGDFYDPQKAVQGLNSFCMRRSAERAVAACTAAAKQFPSTVRYRAQLARALAHTGDFERAHIEARAAAAAGSTPAMILMGVMSQRGLGTAPDEAKALAWYRKAAEAGDRRGASLAGLPVTYTAPSIAEQAERGDARAQHNLAAQLERGKKYDEAFQWYERAARQGFEASAMNLAQMYEKGLGVKEDRAEAQKRYRALAAQGNGEARYRFARLAAAAGQYDEAVKAFERSVREDDYRAMLDLGELYEQGHGVQKDVKRALALYERAAERSRWARFKLGALYVAGEGIPKDYAKAHQWFRRSAADGNAAARNNLGVMYDQGLGVAVDYVEARDLYLAALKGGVPHAKGNLENFYAEGRGAPPGSLGAAWYRPGAEAGIASAQYRLGQMYAKGEGVPQNDRAADELLLEAAQQGHREAARAFADRLAQKGDARRAELFMRAFDEQARAHPIPPWPAGLSLDPGEDEQRKIQTRVAGVGMAQAVGLDAAMGNVYEVIPWIPEIDGKSKAK